MKVILGSLLLCVLCGVLAVAQTESEARKPVSAKENGAASEPQISLKEYREILEKERKILDEQSERYYGRVDTLINRATWFFGVVGLIVGGLLTWIGISSRKELKEARKEASEAYRSELEKQGLTLIKQQSLELQNEYRELQIKYRDLQREHQRLQGEIEAINAYKTKQIIWLDWQDEHKPEREIKMLETAGLQKIKWRAHKSKEPVNFETADLVILSYADKEPGSEELFQSVLSAIESQTPSLPLIVYTLWLDDVKKQRLSSGTWQLTANYPMTLLSHTLMLARLDRS